MGKVNGKDLIIYISDDQFPIACARSVSFDIQRDMIETSVKGSGVFRTYVYGAGSYTGSIEGLTFLDYGSSTYCLPDFYNGIINGTTYMIDFYEHDNNTPQNYLTKRCYFIVESINETVSFDNMSTFTLNFRGVGAPEITYGTI